MFGCMLNRMIQFYEIRTKLSDMDMAKKKAIEESWLAYLK